MDDLYWLLYSNSSLAAWLVSFNAVVLEYLHAPYLYVYRYIRDLGVFLCM